jgi:hypothetical protein
MGMKHSIKYMMVTLCVVSLVPTVAMGTVFVNQSNTNAQQFAPCPAGDLDLSTAAGLQTEVLFAAGGLVNVVFNAECTVDTSHFAWVAVNIWIDPAPVIPGPAGDLLYTFSGTDQAFCAGDNIAGLGGWVTASIHTVAGLPYGVHSIRVEKVGIGTTACRIDDTRLIVND